MLTIIRPVSEPASYEVKCVEWASAREALRSVRWKVFVEEQHVPEELEWDEEDARSRHVLALAADGAPVGTGRLLPDGHIGRMAVLAAWRNRGVGSALLKLLLRLARESGHTAVRLHAQTHAAGFYAKHGFEVDGAEFMEAGIPHVLMARTLS
jgi:predicted GNAT family N-acyltransferase